MEGERNYSDRVQRINIINFTAHNRERNNIWSNVTYINGPIISMQNTLSSTPYHEVILFLMPVLVGVLQVNGQGTSATKPLMETHKANMCIFLSALIIYCFAYYGDMKLYSYRPQIFSSIAVISGSLSSFSLLSMILPHPYGNFSFILWAFILPVLAGFDVYKRLHNKIWLVGNRFRGINQPQLLPF